MKGIDPSSIKFHVEEGDFENWFTMLGDKSLAGQVAALRGKNISPDKLRDKVSSMVSNARRSVTRYRRFEGKEAQVSRYPCGQVLNWMTAFICHFLKESFTIYEVVSPNRILLPNWRVMS